MQELLTETKKRVATLELLEEARDAREVQLYKAIKYLCKVKNSEEAYDKAIVGPHNRPVVLPALLDEDDAGGVWKMSYSLLQDAEKREHQYIKAKQLGLHQQVARNRAKRDGKNQPSQQSPEQGMGGLI